MLLSWLGGDGELASSFGKEEAGSLLPLHSWPVIGLGLAHLVPFWRGGAKDRAAASSASTAESAPLIHGSRRRIHGTGGAF